MINILLNGCNGKMGQTISNLVDQSEDLCIVSGNSPYGINSYNYPMHRNIFECNEDFDIIVDFSVPDFLDDLLTFALKKKKPLLIATTGFSTQQITKIKKASKQIPLFFCANTCLGVNLLLDIVKKVATILGDNYDIEIVEKHHNQKIDAPSGTALVIANAINEVSKTKYEYVYDRHSERKKRSKKEIGLHSIRGGTYVGEHKVIFAGNDEFIEIKHSATSKKVFAEGAIRAVKYLIDKPIGLYTMDDLVK